MWVTSMCVHACVRLPATCISTMLIAFRLLGGQGYGFSQDPLRLNLFFFVSFFEDVYVRNKRSLGRLVEL